LSASNGEISLSLPRCFRRPVAILTTHDRIAFSPALEERTALLADVPDVRIYFVGERPRRGQWGREDLDDDGEEDGSLVEEPLDRNGIRPYNYGWIRYEINHELCMSCKWIFGIYGIKTMTLFCASLIGDVYSIHCCGFVIELGLDI
jgi:hypothetical protein